MKTLVGLSALASLAAARPGGFPGLHLRQAAGSNASASGLLPAYDYVVIGAGPAGLTVANRLSEDEGTTVLVLEAGELDKGEDSVTVPGLAGTAVGTQYDWNVSYTKHSAVADRAVSIPLGKVVGGSTKLNRMVFDRGSKSDYDRWATLGNEGWGFDALLPYFKKTESFTPPQDEVASEFGISFDGADHGTDGLVKTTFSPFVWPTTKNMVAAVKELGIAISKSAYGGDAIGAYWTTHNQDADARRSSAREAYYDPFASRANLHLLTGHLATRLILQTAGDGADAQVGAVEYAPTAGGPSNSTIRVKKEAILAAGAIHSPQLLQVSGIGDKSYLSSIDVQSVVDLPGVGQNFQDHVMLTMVATVTYDETSAALQSNASFAAQAMDEYKKSATGPLSGPGGDFLAFLPLSTYTNASAKIHAAAAAQDPAALLPADASAGVYGAAYAAQHKLLASRLAAADSAPLEVIWTDGALTFGLQHPFSRGSVKAASGSVRDAPLASPGFLTNPVDVQLLVEAVRFGRRVLGTAAVAPLKPLEVAPGANVTTDAQIAAWIRQNAGTLFHPSGSCHMGPRKEGGVVDQELKVYGTSNLRVVDASVMPLLPAAHTMTTVYAVAEKVSDIIRGKLVSTS